MKARNKKKLIGILKHLDAGLVSVAKHTVKHCQMIANLQERVDKLEAVVGENVEERMNKKKGLN